MEIYRKPVIGRLHLELSPGSTCFRLFPWKGRVVMVGAVTTAWDSHHAVVPVMRDRFVLLRINGTQSRIASGTKAIENTGHETEMRDGLARLAAGVIAGVDPTRAPTPTKHEQQAILAAANPVSLARTAVEFDYRGDVIDAHAPEAPTRLAKQLTQLFRGAVAIGIDRAAALRLAVRCARDSMPPIRLQIIQDLAASPHSTPTEVRKRIGKPRATVDRQLQALHTLGVVWLDEVEVEGAFGKVQTHSHYSLTDDIDPGALDPSTVTEKIITPTHTHREARQDSTDTSADIPEHIRDGYRRDNRVHRNDGNRWKQTSSAGVTTRR
jgi:hypothetical protein